MDREVRFVGAMGAEGTHWAGLAPFVDTPHLFQNLGDGTYFHSGRQAVRACVAAGARMTFKLLWNGAIAMTGGQAATGAKPLAELVRELLADGVRRVVVATDDRAVRRLARRERAVERVGVADWESALARLAHEPGVTAAVYDRLCANEKQRLERRGLRARPTERVLIHEDVCEGCGDCGRRSECASLSPVSTALGRKTRVHESSCSDDRSCLAGDCPSFLSVATARRAPPPLEQLLPAALPDPPAPRWDRERFEISMVGVGSTGVVTVDALVVRAAELDGLVALHLDQTGLAQRGGKVVSNCILARGALAGSPRVAWGGADVLLAFDPLGAADAAGLRALDPARTRVVAHARVAPTAESVRRSEHEPPALDALLAALSAHALGLEAVPAEALAEAALDEGRAANVLLLGFALQRGLVPVSAANLERAIRENGVAVEANLGALRVGRALACDASLAARLLAGARPPAAGEDGSPAEAAERLGGAWSALAPALDGMVDPEDDGALAPRVAGRALDLREGFGPAQASRYLGALLPLAGACARHGEATAPILAAAARELYRILAPKDEYEVARLLVAGPYRRWLERRSDGPLRLRYHLHPPLLRALGLRRKLALGRWVEPLLRALVAARRVRGSWLDPFAHSAVRRAERALVPWYEQLIARVAQRLEPGTAELALAVVSAASRIRGYEELKLSRIAAAREEADRLLARLEAR
jgi:indolepyruvate ferredoxin oxidoreductase